MNIRTFFKYKNNFSDDDTLSKAKFDTLIIAIVVSTIGLIYGIVGNIIRELYDVIYIEIFIILTNIVFLFILRSRVDSFKPISKIMTLQFSLLFIYLYYRYEIEEMKFLWLYTHPVLLLYLQNIKSASYWIVFMLSMILILPFQPFIESNYSVFQSTYIAFVFMVITIIIYFYKIQMIQAREIIARQRIDIEKKYKELSKKDSMLTAQSKQAVMGEMMSMIAHQWRQPLSTVTLNISNIQFKKMLGQEVSDEDLNKALSEISDTVVYLSDTVDDFQTFFHPKKEKSVIEIHELLQKAVNFVAPRTKEHKIEITVNKYIEIEIVTYVNELVQILLNILNNAIDALESAKKEMPKIIIYVELKGQYIYISIVDNAKGIPKEIIDDVFNPYFSTKGKNGTGLGLYMSQMLAQKQFDGELSFTSSTLGTHFLVKIKKDISS